MRCRALRSWVRKEREKGVSLSRIVLLHLPRKLVSRWYSRGAAWVNEFLINRAFNVSRFRDFQDLHRGDLGDHFYVVVMPNILHFLKPCLALVPKKIRVFLILNGTRGWEEEYIRDHYPEYPAFSLITFPCSSLSHGVVLNLLIRNNPSNFGIIDHDLYLFDKGVFDRLEFGKDECVIGLFEIVNRRSGLSFSTTHFMFLNVDLVR